MCGGDSAVTAKVAMERYPPFRRATAGTIGRPATGTELIPLIDEGVARNAHDSRAQRFAVVYHLISLTHNGDCGPFCTLADDDTFRCGTRC